MTIKLPVDVGEKLRQIAKENCRTMASQITYLLKRYTKEEEEFEEYFQRNNLQKTLDEALQGENCYTFNSFSEAEEFLNQKEKIWENECK